jgi:hypothetical protein
VVVVVGTTVGVDCGRVWVGVAAGGGASGVMTGSWVCTGAAGAAGDGEAGDGIGGACAAGGSAGACARAPGPSLLAGAGATVVVMGSSGAACDTWALSRALGAMAANTATVAMIFFT